MPALSERVFKRLVDLPGKAFAVYWIALQQAKIEQDNPVPLTNVRLEQCGLTRNQKVRALAVLEKAGLIRVERRERRNPLVYLYEE
jgi:hypothetical protein